MRPAVRWQRIFIATGEHIGYTALALGYRVIRQNLGCGNATRGGRKTPDACPVRRAPRHCEPRSANRASMVLVAKYGVLSSIERSQDEPGIALGVQR